MPPACMLAGTWPWNSSALSACWQAAGGRPWRGSRLPAHPLARGVCKGAGHARPASDCSLYACQARLLDTPFPPSPPTPSCFQSSSFGSTDSIRTQVSVGPEREGMMTPPGHQGSRADPQAKGLALGPPGPLLREETNSLGAPWSAAADSSQVLSLSPHASGYTEIPSCPLQRSQEYRSPATPPLGALRPALRCLPLHRNA